MIVNDLRGERIRKEYNNHTEILENIVKKNQKRGILKNINFYTGRVYNLAEMAGIGYLTGYVLGNGDHGVATQFAEYAMVFEFCGDIGVLLPLKKMIEKAQNRAKNNIDEEREKVSRLEKTKGFHSYDPKHGLDFTNHPHNQFNMVENFTQDNYWGNLETARKPIGMAIGNILTYASLFWTTSLIVDIENNIVDILGPNPIQKGLELSHYAFNHLEPLKNYLSFESHKHVGDLNQMQMINLGITYGLIKSAKQFLKGNYQRLRTLNMKN